MIKENKITKDQALQILHSHMQNQNLRRHCYAVGAVMKSLAKHFKESESLWEITGILHDADYEKTKDDTDNHTKLVVQWIKEVGGYPKITNAILAHGWKFVSGNPEPESNMQWSLYCCDELTGLIVATALVHPNKKLSSISADSVLKKWNQKSFAAGVDRKQIELCEKKLKIQLKDFIQISLTAMQGISKELGL